MSRFLFFVASLILAPVASAQIQTQPVEIVEAAPPAVFSDRAGFWPTENQTTDSLLLDSSSLNDRWNSVPGIEVRESGSPTFSIRGTAAADRVLKLVEGAALNMADGVGASDLLIPTEVMSQVSILKGPSSVFYGSSAMAGAVDHRLRYFERYAIRGTLSEEKAALGTRNIGLIVPYRNRSESFKVQGSLFHENRPMRIRAGNESELQRGTVSADLKSGAWNFAARLVAGNTKGKTSGPTYFPIASTFDTNGTLASLEASRDLGSSNRLALRLTDTRIEGSYDDGTAIESDSSTSRTALNIDLRSQVTDRILVRTFSDLSSNHLSASYIAGQKLHLNEADLGQSFEISLSPELAVQPAYRYASRFGKIFKALGLVREKNRASQFVTFGEGFRAPSLSDRFAQNATFAGNPNLKPERSWALETGGSFEQGQRYGGFLEGVGVKGSIYYTKYNDLVDSVTNGAVLTKVNSGEARSYGAEASLAYGVKIWMFSLGYNYLDAKNETTNEPLRFAPKHQAVVTLAQLIGPVLLEARETLWSSFYDREPNSLGLRELPSWQTFDLTARTLALTDWEMKAGVLNLFGEKRELTIGYPEPERRIFVSALRFF